MKDGKEMIKAVIFDMFETLITHHKSPLYFGAHMAADAGIPVEEFLPVWRATEDNRTLGKYTVDQVVEDILKQKDCYKEEIVKLIMNKRKNVTRVCFQNLHPEIIPMLSSLKKQGILIGLISNCFSEEAEAIRESILFPYFDAVCLSYEEGVMKPEAEIYHRCVSKLGVRLEECMYVGDGGSYELETARALNMVPAQAVWYLKDGTNQPRKRMPEFMQLETPMEVIKYIEKEKEYGNI